MYTSLKRIASLAVEAASSTSDDSSPTITETCLQKNASKKCSINMLLSIMLVNSYRMFKKPCEY